MGFTREAAELLGLTEKTVLLFSLIDEGDLAVLVCDDTEHRGFHVQKTGQYFYIRMKNFFDSQSLDYIERRVTYDISKTTELFNGKTVFKFKRGIYERRSSGDSSIGEESLDEK